MDYEVEHGIMPATKARYEIYFPSSKDSKPPCVLLIHGFQGKLEFHRGTAIRLANTGICCLIVDMLPLMSFFKETRLKLREANVQAILSYIQWLKENKNERIDTTRILLSGHSAGGAVAFETAVYLTNNEIVGVLLLDAVPWISTLDKGMSCSHLTAPGYKEVTSPLLNKVIVMSFRGEPTSFNADGLVLELLARSIQKDAASFDLKIISARHGDFISSSPTSQSSPADGKILNMIMNCLGLFSPNVKIREHIQNLIVSFCQSVLFKDGAQKLAFENQVEAMLKEKVIEIGQVDQTLPSKREKLPPFLQ